MKVKENNYRSLMKNHENFMKKPALKYSIFEK